MRPEVQVLPGPPPALTSEMLVIVSGVSFDGGVPDQELLPGYRSWSWMCCSRSPHRPVEAPHRPVDCHPRSENGPSGPSTTCLVGLTRPTLAAPLTTGRSRPPRRRTRRPLRLGSAGRAVPGRPYRRGVRWARDAAPAGPCPPAWWVGRSLATRPRAVRPRERAGRRAGPGRSAIPPGSGFDRGRKCSCWPKPDDARPCTPQTCDWRCRACRIHGRPFYSHGDLQYLEHGTGPLAAELDRLRQAKGTMKGGTARDAAAHDDDGWGALPRGAAGLAPRRRRSRTVTELYYPGLQDPPSGHDGRNAGRGQ